MEAFLCELHQLFPRELICKQFTDFLLLRLIFRSALPFAVHPSLLTPAVPLLLIFLKLLMQLL